MATSSEESHRLYLTRLAMAAMPALPDDYDDAVRILEIQRDLLDRLWLRPRPVTDRSIAANDADGERVVVFQPPGRQP
jgi:hypothetical protein